MAGAAGLAGMAATRSGAGLTSVAVPDACLETVAGFDPNLMTVPLACDDDGKILAAAASHVLELSQVASSVGLGPGLAQSTELTRFVTELYRSVDRPMVVDADGLNALSQTAQTLGHPCGPRILTPHIGEFRRLLVADGESSSELSVDACRSAAEPFAHRHGLVLVLKGHQSIVTDGSETYTNTTGNPGMASGGSGDVLTGIIVALLGQGLSVMEAAVLGVHVHGLAGDHARNRFGEISMTARDIVTCLPAAFGDLPRAHP